MFQVDTGQPASFYRRPIAVIMVFNAAALLLTLWLMIDLLREQTIIRMLIKQLPPSGVEPAKEMASELLWQFRLSVLLVINLIATALSVVLLWRAYHVSQESLRDIQALAIDILNSMDQIVITLDLEGRVTSINQRGDELLKLDQRYLGKALVEVEPLKPFEQCRQECLAEKQSTQWRDFPYQHNGNRVQLRAMCQPLKSRDRREIGSILQVRDVTVAVLVEERMRRMERYMELGNLIAGLYHEIKNPLAALSLYVQLISEKYRPRDDEDETPQMLEVVRTELMRVNGVLESFRDFASISQLSKSSVRLQQLIERQIKFHAHTAAAQGVTIKTDLGEEPVQLCIDEAKIEQVFLNLLVNALEAMPDGGTLTVRLRAEETSVTVEVQDTGHGVPESVRSRIFDPYFTTKMQGTGMGLALCEKIMRQHGGTLNYRPLSLGSSFEFTLPL
ncbi:MAG: two-component system sensor histidine kinase NtrB, partial [Aureliella sp.]